MWNQQGSTDVKFSRTSSLPSEAALSILSPGDGGETGPSVSNAAQSKSGRDAEAGRTIDRCRGRSADEEKKWRGLHRLQHLPLGDSEHRARKKPPTFSCPPRLTAQTGKCRMRVVGFVGDVDRVEMVELKVWCREGESGPAEGGRDAPGQ